MLLPMASLLQVENPIHCFLGRDIYKHLTSLLGERELCTLPDKFNKGEKY